MTDHDKTKDELLKELQELKQEHNSLQESYDTDITAHNLAEEALRVKDWVIESSTNAIVTSDLEGNLNYVNLAFLKLWGYGSSEEVLGKPAVGFWQMGEKAAEVMEAVRTKGGWIGELVARGKNGAPFDVEVASSMVVNDAGQTICMMASFADITERKQAEEALRDSEKKYRLLIDTANESIIIAQDGKIKFVNPMTLALMEGYSEQELIDRLFTRFIYPDDRSVVTENYGHRIANEEVQPRYTFRVVTRDGMVKWVEINAALIEWQGKPATLNFLTDITERKKAEQELLKAKEHAEESDRLKSAFLANMSHEIRTPMNGILGFAEQLKEPNLTGEEQQEYIRIIEKSGARMLNIINDIVDISKIESGQMEVDIKESNINEQIEYVYHFFKPEVERKNLQFSFTNRLPAKEAIIKTDREKIYAILTNLVKNAIKFTSEGSIEFGYDLVESDNYPSLRQYQFFVKDTGIGIPQDRQEVIFERFVQADISDKRALQGAGLGLSISKAYVEMLGGKIRVESEPGKGSIFYFTIPYQAETQAKIVIANVASADVAMDQIKKLKILIAEDDETSDILFTRMLKKSSHEVLHAKTGVETVEACRDNPDIDLILMDIQMPEMDGYEATRRIRQFNSEVIIIAQTAFALTGEREKAIAAGCNDYIAKPIKKDELMALIQKYFNT